VTLLVPESSQNEMYHQIQESNPMELMGYEMASLE
jgi:hypothetical protein